MLWELYREIGTRIRRERDSLGFSQIDLATEVGLTRTSIVNIESGRQRLPIHVLYSIASAMGVSAYCLLPKNSMESEENEDRNE
jgi:transcriptional regulator with XRE-family HTH domain